MLTSEDNWDIVKGINSRENITNEEFDLLETLSSDREYYIRLAVAEALFDRVSQKAEDILLKLLNDKDELVRVEACDSLRSSKSKGIIEILKKHTQSSSRLVRGYAVSSIADIGVNLNMVGDSNLISFLQTSLSREKDTWVKVNYFRALHLITKNRVYFTNIANEINNDIYQIRCFVINTLIDIKNKENIGAIRIAFENRLKIEDPECIAVISSIEEALEEL